MSQTSAGTGELRTERLVLRPLRGSDLDALAAIYTDPQTMRYLGGPRTRDHTRTGLEWMITAHAEQGFGLWATTLVEGGTLIGRCGLLIQDVKGSRETEIAYLLGSEWWGRGYATEAATAIRNHAQSQLGFERLISLIAPANVASQAVARRIGMYHERDLTFEGRPTSLFALENRCQAPIFQGHA